MVFGYFVNHNNASISLEIVCVCACTSVLHIILACDKCFVLSNNDILCKILVGRENGNLHENFILIDHFLFFSNVISLRTTKL